MDAQTVKIEMGGRMLADYAGPLTKFEIETSGDGVKVTTWLPHSKPKRKPKCTKCGRQ